jgi:hypothetical protein
MRVAAGRLKRHTRLGFQVVVADVAVAREKLPAPGRAGK